jgi:hypothetical protein
MSHRLRGFSLRSHRWVLAVILAGALAIRLMTVHFGLPAMLDPDELTFELGALKMINGGDLNPEWFGHPATTTMYLLAILDAAVLALGLLSGRFDSLDRFSAAIYADPGILVLPHRVAIVAIAVIGIALAYRLADRLFDRDTAIVTAAVLAISPVHITYSQIVRTDMMATVFAQAAMLAALAFARHSGAKAYLGTVLLVALAITTKWPYALFFLALVGAVVLRWQPRLVTTRTAARLVIGAGLLVLAAMVAISPFLIIEFNTVIVNLQGEAQVHHLGATGSTLPANAWWYLKGPMLRALGPLGLVLAGIGLWQARRNREFLAICAIPAVASFLLISSQNIVWERWVLPLVPVAAMLAAYVLVRGWRMVASRIGQRGAAALGIAALGAMLVPLGLSARSDGIERMNDTRLMATRWLVEHAEPGSSVMVEHFAFDLLATGVFQIYFPLGESGCLEARDQLSKRVDNTTVNAARGGRSNLDFGTLAPDLVEACTTDYAVLTHYLRYEAEKDRFPQEYANYQRLLATSEVVAEFYPEDGASGIRPTVIVRRLGPAGPLQP